MVITEYNPHAQRLPGRGGVMYALTLGNSATCEFDGFLSLEEIRQGKYAKSLLRVQSQLEEMARSTGFLPDFFRPEPGFDMYPRWSSEIRVCGQRWSSQTLILGGGGVKKKGMATYQESERLYSAARTMQTVGKLLKEYLETTGAYESRNGGFVDARGIPIPTIRLS